MIETEECGADFKLATLIFIVWSLQRKHYCFNCMYLSVLEAPGGF